MDLGLKARVKSKSLGLKARVKPEFLKPLRKDLITKRKAPDQMVQQHLVIIKKNIP
jgi:hypothetical protein